MILKYINNILTNKISLIFIFLLIFKLPIINPVYFIFFILFLLFVFSVSEFKKKININILIVLILTISLSYIFNKKTIIENHAIFLPSVNNQDLYLNENDQIFRLLINDFYKAYSENDLNCKNQLSGCWKDIKLNKIYSRSFDQIKFGDQDYSRKVNSINHSNISNARLGNINNLELTWYNNPDYWWDKDKPNKIKRINAPYIIQYDFMDEKYTKSKICWKGKAIINDQSHIIYNKEIKCQKIDKNFKILFFSFDNILEVKLKKSVTIIIIDLVFEIIKILSLIILIYFLIQRIDFFKLTNYLLISVFSTFALIYTIITKKEFSFGYQPLQAGMDGLVHEGYGRNMYENFLNYNFIEVLKGAENIYYFMPGLRYVTFLEKLFFGDNHFGLYLILIFFPIIFYIFFLKFKFNKMFAILLILFFIIIKIPHLGFSYQHYVRNLLTVYPETLAIFSFLLCSIFLFKKNYFVSGLFCAIMVFLRPNYLPVFLTINFYNLLISLKEKDNKRLSTFLFGSSFVFLMLLHNYIFGGKALILFVKNIPGSSRVSIYPHEYLYVFQNNDSYQKITAHLKNLLTTGRNNNIIVIIINSIFLLNLIIYYLFNCKKFYNYNVFFCLISLIQITPSLFYLNTNRYAYFSWLLITFSNLLISREYYNKLKKINY